MILKLLAFNLAICLLLVLETESKNTKVEDLLSEKHGKEKAQRICSKVAKLKQHHKDRLIAKLAKLGITLPLVDSTPTEPTEDDVENKGKNSIDRINRKATNLECVIKGDIIPTEEQVDSLLDQATKTVDQTVSQVGGVVDTTIKKIGGLLEKINPRFRRAGPIASPGPGGWNYKWPVFGVGDVPYYFDASIPEATRVKVRAAFRWYYDRTCLNPVENANAVGDKIVIGAFGAGCLSSVGRVGNTQQISFDQKCWEMGIAAHEIGHALGLWHEQDRWDRENTVKVNFTNVKPDNTWDELETPATNNNYGYPYDVDSIMHYSQFSDCIDCSIPTANAVDGWFQRSIGNGNMRPTFRDIQSLNTHYGCSCPNTLSCQRGGYINPAYCTSCACPEGFGGTLCDQRQTSTNGGASCGGTITLTSTAQPIELTVGTVTNVVNEEFQMCWWWLQAPAGKYVDIQITEIGDQTGSMTCYFGYVEIKSYYPTWMNAGTRYCTPTDVTKYGHYDTSISTQDKNLAVIGVASKYNVYRLKANVKYV